MSIVVVAVVIVPCNRTLIFRSIYSSRYVQLCSAPESVLYPLPDNVSNSHLCLALIPSSDEPPNNQVLALKPLLPIPHRIVLISPQIRQRIQRSIQILRQHLLVEAVKCQAARRIPSSEVGIRPTRSIEVAPRGDVEDTATDCEVDWSAVLAVIRKEGSRRKGAKDGRWWLFGKGGWGRGAK